jgi:predicted metal-dependent hydrolase
MIPSYTIQYSYRKTVGIRINRKGELIVSAPIGVSEQRVNLFVTSKKDRITQKISYIKNNIPDTIITISKQMKDHALIQILPRIEYYADIMKVSYNNLKITTAQTKR